MKPLWIGLLLGLAGWLMGNGSPFLGVYLTDPTSVQIQKYAAEGVIVNGVIPDAPAERAGLKKDDMIIRLNDRSITTTNTFLTELQQYNVGDTIRIVTVSPQGISATHEVVLRDRNQMVPYTFSFYMPDDNPMGMSLTEITPQLREFFGVPYGVMISEIEMNSPADSAGLRAGDIVMKIDGTIVDSPMDVHHELCKVDSHHVVSVDVNRKGERKTYSLRVDASCNPATLPDDSLHEYLFDPGVGQIEIPDLDNIEKAIQAYADKVEAEGKHLDKDDLRKHFEQIEKELKRIQKQLDEK